MPISIPCTNSPPSNGWRANCPRSAFRRSSDVLPQIKEYERVSTTIVNAYVRPLVRHYLANLEQRLKQAGFKGSLFIILSHGGMAPVEEASRLAAGTVLSGPAGGISGGRRCAELIGIPDLVPFDMGGTSYRHLADLGGPRLAVRRRHARRPAHRAAQPRHRQHRGRRRLDRVCRCRRHLARRPGKRGLGAGAGLLRQWRQSRHRHRRQCRAWLSRRLSLHGRRAAARRCGGGNRRRPRGRVAWTLTRSKPPPVFSG